MLKIYDVKSTRIYISQPSSGVSQMEQMRIQTTQQVSYIFAGKVNNINDAFQFAHKYTNIPKSRKENPQKLNQEKISSKTPRGKKDSTKDITTDTTSDSQVNSNFPNRWSPASLTFNNYFYLFLYPHTTRTITNNNALHPKPPKNQNRRAALGRPAIKITGGASTSPRSTNPRPQFCPGSSDT